MSNEDMVLEVQYYDGNGIHTTTFHGPDYKGYEAGDHWLIVYVNKTPAYRWPRERIVMIREYPKAAKETQ